MLTKAFPIALPSMQQVSPSKDCQARIDRYDSIVRWKPPSIQLLNFQQPVAKEQKIGSFAVWMDWHCQRAKSGMGSNTEMDCIFAANKKFGEPHFCKMRACREESGQSGLSNCVKTFELFFEEMKL